jgi:hypothetical protein
MSGITSPAVGITEEMVVAGADVIDPTHAFASTKRTVREVLEAALVGRTVVQLPEPDGEDSDGDPSWSLRSKGGEVVAYLEEGAQPHVTAFDLRGSEGAPADVAEAYGLAMIAAARTARRLASGSSESGEPNGD